MSSAAEESDDLGAYISALVLNMGTPSQAQIDAFHAAGSAANRRGKPIVFDPVGVGATPFRMRTASALLNAVHVSVVKGNASEIGALSGLSEVQSRGVDSVGDGFKQPAEVVRSLARREKVTVAMSGVIDHVTDGQTVVRIHNGHPYQGTLTGSGCSASTAVACFAGVAGAAHSMLLPTVAAITTINVAAELAAARIGSSGPGSFRAAFIDACATITPEDVTKHGKIDLM